MLSQREMNESEQLWLSRVKRYFEIVQWARNLDLEPLVGLSALAQSWIAEAGLATLPLDGLSALAQSRIAEVEAGLVTRPRLIVHPATRVPIRTVHATRVDRNMKLRMISTDTSFNERLSGRYDYVPIVSFVDEMLSKIASSLDPERVLKFLRNLRLKYREEKDEVKERALHFLANAYYGFDTRYYAWFSLTAFTTAPLGTTFSRWEIEDVCTQQVRIQTVTLISRGLNHTSKFADLRFLGRAQKCCQLFLTNSN